MQGWGRFGSEKDFMDWINKHVCSIVSPALFQLQEQINELQKQVTELNSLIYRSEPENDDEDRKQEIR